MMETVGLIGIVGISMLIGAVLGILAFIAWAFRPYRGGW